MNKEDILFTAPQIRYFTGCRTQALKLDNYS